MGDTRIIKRYSNRKLYDTTHSRYVTLDQIGELVRSGEEVKIIDNTSKEDLTSVTLAQIIFEEEKRKKSFLPLNTLKSILQSSGEQIQEFARSLKEGAAERIKNIRQKDPQKDDETGALDRPEAISLEEVKTTEVKAPEAKAGTPDRPEEKKFFQNVIDGSQQTIQEVQRRLDERIKTTLQTLTVPIDALRREFTDLSGRLERLERRLSEIGEARVARHEKTDNSTTDHKA
jgi:polyhydroxyalkanoate synthesis repressor PhaR